MRESFYSCGQPEAPGMDAKVGMSDMVANANVENDQVNLPPLSECV